MKHVVLLLALFLCPIAASAQQWELSIGGSAAPDAWVTVYQNHMDSAYSGGYHLGLTLGAGPFATGNEPPNVNSYDGAPLDFWTVGRVNHSANLYVEVPFMLDVDGLLLGAAAGIEFDFDKIYYYSDVSNSWWHNSANDEPGTTRFSFGGKLGYRFGRHAIIAEWNNFRKFGAEFLFPI